MRITVVGLHDELVRVLRASFPGESLEIVCFPDVAAALAAPVPPAVAWLLVDARSLGDRVSELRAWVRQQPQAQSVLLCDDDLPWPAQLAEQAGFADWHPKGRLNQLRASLDPVSAA
jgi:hypothetical protein